MKPVFEILPEAIFFQQTNLICEVSPNSFSYVFENDVYKKFHGLSVYHFKKEKNIHELKEIFNEQALLKKKYKNLFISYSFPESVLLPDELYKPGEKEVLLNMLFGDLHSNTILTDVIAEKKMRNVYRIPLEIHHTIIEQFPLANFSHQYSLLVKEMINDKNVLNVIIYQDTFVAALIKNDELQIIQTYFYQSATDIVYHLLNICKQFSAEEMPLRFAGMISNDSELYNEIHHYFSNISFGQLPKEYEYAERIKTFPPYYFSHLFSPALCV